MYHCGLRLVKEQCVLNCPKIAAQLALNKKQLCKCLPSVAIKF